MTMLPPTPHPHEVARSDGHVDQIRDIIFGGQMREYEHRFAQLEDRIITEQEKLRQETQDQARGIQELIEAAFRHAAVQAESERTQQINAAQQFAKEMRASLENLGRELKEAGERNEQRFGALAGQLKALEETSRRERDALAAAVVSRSSVADLFAELSTRFRGPSA